MGLLDELAGSAMSGMLGNSSNPLMHAAMEMIQNQPGGLSGLVQSFEQKGMGGMVQSWVSNGPNPPVSGDQVTSVLGSDALKNLAAKAGIPADQAGSQLAALLPGLVDKLTPNGHVGDAGGLLSAAMNMLRPKAS